MSLHSNGVLVGGPSSRAGSASGTRIKVAHTSLQHDKFHAPPPPVQTEALKDPFSVYGTKLSNIEQLATKAQIASHHIVIDCVRILEDILVHAAQTFLEHRQPPLLLSLTVDHAQAGVAERLRDAEIISPWTNRQIEDARKLAKWVLISSAREVPLETSHALLALVTKLCAGFMADVEHAASGKPKSGCAAHHAFCREMMPQHLDVVGGPHNAHTLGRPATAAVAADGNGAASPTSPTASAGVAPTGGLANPDLKKPMPRAHASLPYGWTREQFESACAPLHNTTHLDLAAVEEEEEELERERASALEAERQEKIRLREEASERRRERREAEEAARARGRDGVDGDLSDLDENPEEVDSEEERLTARRREARAAAGEGALDDEYEEDEDADDEDDDDDVRAEKAARRAEREARKAQDAEDEKVANEPIPAVAPKPSRFAFTFCCIVCHTVLLRAKDIDRIHSNQVWTKPGKGLTKTLLRNHTDSWLSRPADEIEKPTNVDEDEEEEVIPDDDDDVIVGPDAPVKDEGALKREESIGVHCAGCDYYLGRFFTSRDAFRLIYIQRSSGQNFMYHTGSISADRLRPNMRRLTEEEEEALETAQAEAEEQGSDEEEDAYHARLQRQAEAKKAEPIPPIIGLPNEYTDMRQASLYPFPRFGSSTPYHRPSSWQVFHTMVTDAAAAEALMKDALPSSPNDPTSPSNGATGKGGLSSSGLLSSTLGKSLTVGSKSSTKTNSRTYRPAIPSIGLIHTMLRRHPDSHYSLPPETKEFSMSTTADLSVLLWTDRIFHNRRALDAVSQRIVQLFQHFPSGIYANTSSPPIPIFTYFFIRDGPDFTHCRGTARYIFHYLTKKDDSKLKRVQYTFKKFVKSLGKYENAVYHMTAGGYGGHRFVLVKVGGAYRILQSNHCLESPKDRYTALQWLSSDYPWSRILGLGELYAFLAKFEEARRGRKQIWEELFTCGQKAQGLYDVSDTWQPEQVFFSVAKLQDNVIAL